MLSIGWGSQTISQDISGDIRIFRVNPYSAEFKNGMFQF